MDFHTLGWHVELGLWTPTLWCGLETWGDGLLRFGAAPRLWVMAFHSSVLPLELG